jgi:large subunit ribosomal protein L10
VNREEKAAVIAGLKERFQRASVTLVASNLGLTVEQSRQLRRTVKAAGGECKVAKHTLTRRALETSKFTAVERLLEGPRSLVFGFDDPVAVAKVLVDFADQNAKLTIDGGAVEGQILSAEQVKNFAKMPGLSTLRARVVRQVTGPSARLASTVRGPAIRIAGAISALVEKLEADGMGG